MAKIGSVHTPKARKAMLLGSGELGKEVALELQRLGVEVIACDKYPDAPAMQVAHRSYVFNMLDGDELRRHVEFERPDHIIPEIEAIATPHAFGAGERGIQRDPDSPRGMADNEPRRNPKTRRRRIGNHHVSLSLRIHPRRI